MSDCTIALSGLSDTDAAAFEAVIDALPGNRWQVISDTPATLLVVDIDTVWGHMDWLRATANGQQVAAFTRDPQVRNCDMVLHKPLHAREFAALLADLAGSAPSAEPVAQPFAQRRRHAAAPPGDTLHATTAARPTDPVRVVAPPPATPVVSAPTMPEPEPAPVLTLGECLLAGNICTPVIIKGTDGTRLVLDPERGGYTGSTTLKPLAALLRTPMTQAAPMDETAVARMRQAPALPLTRLLWFAALCANPGRLAPTLDPEARYHLARWPQIEREFPRHFRIATAMMKGPGRLEELAAAANAPVGDVADFINAYSVAGYVSCSTPTSAPTPPSGGTRMLSRLRRPFTRGGGREPA